MFGFQPLGFALCSAFENREPTSAAESRNHEAMRIGPTLSRALPVGQSPNGRACPELAEGFSATGSLHEPLQITDSKTVRTPGPRKRKLGSFSALGWSRRSRPA